VPIVRIDIEAGKTTAYKRSLLHAVREAVTEALGVADDRVVQRIVETPAEDIDATEVRSDRLTVIEISMLAGRDAEMKGRLFEGILKRLGRDPGIPAHDIFVVVVDPPAECFCLSAPPAPIPAEEA
jgi:phenylpyruvate tautomerase PptA (4-oxalocrotonate tautomerase family)